MTRRIALHLTGSTAGELMAAAREAESAGVDSLWASELYTHPFVPLSAAACATREIGLGSGVALAFVRSPLTLALGALDLDALSRGRFVLGLGTGVKKLNERWHGVHRWGPPVAHMREVIEFLRLFMKSAHRGEPMRYEGQFLDLEIEGYRRPMEPPREKIPIYLGANHPKMLSLAGEVADGVLGHVFLSPKALRERVWPAIRRGLEVGGRDRREITVGAGITCAIDADRSRARRHAAGPLAFYATVRTYQPFFAADGFAKECEAIREAFFSGNREAAIDRVTDAMIDTYCAAGSVDEVRRKLADWDGLLDVPAVSPPRHFCPPDAQVVYRRRILESLLD